MQASEPGTMDRMELIREVQHLRETVNRLLMAGDGLSTAIDGALADGPRGPTKERLMMAQRKWRHWRLQAQTKPARELVDTFIDDDGRPLGTE